MAFPSNYYIDCVLKYMYNIKDGIKDCDPRIINDATEWLVDNKDAFIKYYNQTDNVRETIHMILDDEDRAIDLADANVSIHGNPIGESMELSEAVSILVENGYILKEGLFSDIKDKIVSKVKNSVAYNDWCKRVSELLEQKYHMTIKELKSILTVDNALFKKCYNMSIKPINFVKAIMNKYSELMRKEWDKEHDIYDFYCSTPSAAMAEAIEAVKDVHLIVEQTIPLNDAITLLTENGYRIIKK